MSSATTSTKRISKNKRLVLIKMWNDGKEDEVKKEGYHVIITKSGLTYLRKLKDDQEKKKKEEPIKKEETKKEPKKRTKKVKKEEEEIPEDPEWLYVPTTPQPKIKKGPKTHSIKEIIAMNDGTEKENKL